MANDATLSIPLTKGKVALIDAADAALIGTLRWQARCNSSGTWYTQAAVKGAKRMTSMHRLIMGAGPDDMVDHINGDGLDNRRANLRFCTHAQNMRNRRLEQSPRKISRFKGVTYKARGKPWAAAIQQGGQRLYLGCYETEEAAAKAYDAAAKVFHGSFARTNVDLGLLRAG